MPITPGPNWRYELKCPAASAASVVQVCSRELPLFFANEALQRRDTARRILGAAGGANKRVAAFPRLADQRTGALLVDRDAYLFSL